MDPRPPVDRRTVLRGAAAIAGAVAAGAVLGSGEGAPAAGPADAASWEKAGPPPGSRGSRPRGPGSPDPARPTKHADKSANPTTSHPDPAQSSTGGDQSPASHEPRPTEPAGTGDSKDPAGGGEGKGDAGGKGDHGGQGDGGGGGAGDGGGDGGGGSGGDPGQPPLVTVAEVPVGGGVVVPPARVVVTQPTPGTFRCFGSRCTHAGCLVDAVSDGTIHCPCHGSLFDMLSGEPVAGPAPAALDRVAIKVKSGGVYLA